MMDGSREIQTEVWTGVREARYGDIPNIAADARAADVTELWAMGRQTAYDALRQGFATSTHVWTGVTRGEPACMFGVVPVSLLEGVGVPWMVAANRLMRHQKEILRHSREYVERMKAVYPKLSNLVDARNSRAIRWLKWCGFQVSDQTVPFGPDRIACRAFGTPEGG